MTTTTIPTDAGAMPAHLFTPPNAWGPRPGLVLVQEIFGVSDYIRARAADLAALGHVVCVPEFYWRLDPPPIDETSEDFLQVAMGLAGQVDWEAAVADGVAALQHLESLDATSGKPGVAGFCWGGGLAFNIAAVADPSVLISWYGSALPSLLDLAPQVTAPSLHHFGTEDAFIDSATVDRISRAVAGPHTQFELYEGAGHAFDNPHPMFHHPAASAAAWQHTVDFLARELPID
ncbi:dienelactone hydrolase family protein [Propionibacteriaceae bacterium Y1700]|uniref:dienelactone hydrolase family protein n=1 Tax=Microlunatus sp. Y1700 TaxID=3418487 RepID=UPI003DA767B7